MHISCWVNLLLVQNKTSPKENQKLYSFVNVTYRNLGTKPQRRHRGSRQRLRNIENATKNFESIKKQQQENQDAGGVPRAFFMLGLFPIVATAGVVFVRDDLREDFKKRCGWN